MLVASGERQKEKSLRRTNATFKNRECSFRRWKKKGAGGKICSASRTGKAGKGKNACSRRGKNVGGTERGRAEEKDGVTKEKRWTRQEQGYPNGPGGKGNLRARKHSKSCAN